MAAEIFELAKYASLRGPTGTERTETATDETSWFRSSDSTASAEHLSAAAIRKVDNESSIGRLLELIETALHRLEACLEFSTAGDNMAADDELMGCRKIFVEMLMFRDVSESVGLLSLKAFQASEIEAIVDAPTLPEALHRTLKRLWAAPFMRFDEACKLAEEIEEAAAITPAAGYVEVTAELLAD